MSNAANDPATTPEQKVMRDIAMAAMDNDAAAIQAAIDSGLNIDDIHASNGLTLLHMAAAHGAMDVAKLLLSIGMDPRTAAEGDIGVTAIDLARFRGHTALVTLLEDHVRQSIAEQLEQELEIGLNIPKKLISAARWGDRYLVEVIVTAETADRVFISDEVARTALHYAAAGGHAEMAQHLINHGADLTAQSIPVGKVGSQLAIEWAVENGHKRVALLLLKAMEEQGLIDEDGAIRTPATMQQLSLAAEDVERRLLSHDDKHLWGTPLDDLRGHWTPGQSRIMAWLRKEFDDAFPPKQSSFAPTETNKLSGPED